WAWKRKWVWYGRRPSSRIFRLRFILHLRTPAVSARIQILAAKPEERRQRLLTAGYDSGRALENADSSQLAWCRSGTRGVRSERTRRYSDADDGRRLGEAPSGRAARSVGIHLRRRLRARVAAPWGGGGGNFTCPTYAER